MLSYVVVTVISAILIIHMYRLARFMEYDKQDIIYKHYPGPCIQVEGADGGSEDLTTLPGGLTFISSGVLRDRPDIKPRILLFDFKNPTHKVTELKIGGNLRGFRPHGLSAWTEPNSDIVTLMVINHGGETEAVEIFEFTPGTNVLKHIKSVSTQGKGLNDITAVGKDSFYGTQDLEYRFKTVMSFIELGGLLALGKVWYFKGQDMKLALSGLWGPNGINVSPDLRYVYVAEFFNKNILTYKRNDDGSLQLVKKLFIDTNPDNIEVDPKTGDLWIGCHPRIYAMMDYLTKYDGKSITPSQVLKIKTEKGVTTSDITEVFLDDGKFCSASSTASYYKRRMLLGTVASELVLCDVL